jgi:hypothetical protein
MGRLTVPRAPIAAAALAAMFASAAAPRAAYAAGIAASARNYSVNDPDALAFKGFGYAACAADAVNGGDYVRWRMTLENKSAYVRTGPRGQHRGDPVHSRRCEGGSHRVGSENSSRCAARRPRGASAQATCR